MQILAEMCIGNWTRDGGDEGAGRGGRVAHSKQAEKAYFNAIRLTVNNLTTTGRKLIELFSYSRQIIYC
jgi:hypothetical protein